MAKNFLYTHIADYVMGDTAKGSAVFLIKKILYMWYPQITKLQVKQTIEFIWLFQ